MAGTRAGYRHLMRAVKQLFKHDPVAYEGARTEVRQHVTAKAAVTDPDQLKALVSQFYEAAEFLQHNVVQGHLNQSGNYEISPVPPREKGQGPFKLNVQTPEEAVASVEAQAEVEAQREADGGAATITIHSGSTPSTGQGGSA